MTVTISQDASEIDLKWMANDPVSLAFVQEAAGPIQGNYTSKVRDRNDVELAVLVVTTARVNVPDGGGTFAAYAATLPTAASFTAASDGTHLRVTIALADSSAVPPGRHNFDIQETGGVTRWRGRVTVIKDITR